MIQRAKDIGQRDISCNLISVPYLLALIVTAYHLSAASITFTDSSEGLTKADLGFSVLVSLENISRDCKAVINAFSTLFLSRTLGKLSKTT